MKPPLLTLSLVLFLFQDQTNAGGSAFFWAASLGTFTANWTKCQGMGVEEIENKKEKKEISTSATRLTIMLWR